MIGLSYHTPGQTKGNQNTEHADRRGGGKSYRQTDTGLPAGRLTQCDGSTSEAGAKGHAKVVGQLHRRRGHALPPGRRLTQDDQ
jgi:hypothetical protein